VSMPDRSLASSGGSVTAGRQSAGRMSASGTTGNDLPSVVSAGTSPGMKLLIAALTALVIGLALAVLLR